MIINITPEAWTKIHENLNDSGFNSLRIGLDIRGCNGYSYTFEPTNDEPIETDHVVEQDGHKVIIAKKDEIFLRGSTLKWTTSKFESKLEFDNPLSTGSCGCGESVSF